LDIEEKLEQLIDINDTLFEQIVRIIIWFSQASALDIADGIKTSSVSTVVVKWFENKIQDKSIWNYFRNKF
jgi:hypothetical protein